MCLAIVAVAAALGGAAIAGARSAQATTSPTPPVVSRSAVSFHDAMRKLWEDHITWTRNVIISFEVNVPDSSATLPDLGAALDRLFQNQVDIGNAIKPYCGNDRGNRLTVLRHDHIAIAGEILQAVQTGQTAAYQDANARWYANAHESTVCSARRWIRPLGSLAEMDQMMKDHLDTTTNEVVAGSTATGPLMLAPTTRSTRSRCRWPTCQCRHHRQLPGQVPAVASELERPALACSSLSGTMRAPQRARARMCQVRRDRDTRRRSCRRSQRECGGARARPSW